MSRTVDRLTWKLDGSWVENEGLWITEIDWSGPMQRLKNLLFAWHEGSWYGADIQEKTVGGVQGLLISPLLAADYLSQPDSVRLMKLQWTQRMLLYIQAAKMVRTSLLQGWYAPNVSGWSAAGQRWKLHGPQSLGQELMEWKSAAAAAGVNHHVPDQWVSLAANEAIHSSEEASLSWHRLIDRVGDNRSADGYRDEEDWWIGLGWKKDETPFRVLLQLIEPDEWSGWRFAVLLQSREDTGYRTALRRAEGGWEVEGAEIPDSWAPFVKERMEKEERKWLQVFPEWENPLAPGTLRMNLSEQEAWAFLEDGSVKLLEAGCSVLLPGWWEAVRSRKLRLKAKVRSSVGSSGQPMFGLDTIVQFDWKLAVGDLDLSEEEFRKLVDENKRLFRLKNEWIHLDPRDLEQLRRWMKKSGKKRGLSFRDVLEMHLRGEMPLDVMDGNEDEVSIKTEVELNEHLSRWMEQLQHISELPLVEKPESFLGELRPYQMQGVSWLAFLRRFGLGGCLADDMGLGKTIQFTAYLLHIIESQGKNASAGPSLLICPTSVIGNWKKELERFAPSLKVVIHYGPRRSKGEAFAESVRDADLVITSYALGPLDEEELSSIEWNALCLDEAQNIKNVYTKQSSAIRKIPARHRIAMTGTPMENRLTELWSIHDFMNPGYLGSLAEFRREVVQPIERTRDEAMIGQLQHWVKPFMLRRLKKDPAIRLALPDKNEAKTYISLTVEQGTLYENMVSDLLEKLDTLSPMQRRGLILATLTRLKQVCDHPSLLNKEEWAAAGQWDASRSNKVTRLLEMVEEIAAEGERCLIFTQFVGMGQMLKLQLEQQLGMRVSYLHGAVPRTERDEMIAEFQNPSERRCAFVLSLKAGGTGLNLTAANHVFHFDRWWNPAVENQATDRAFRIGQTKDVQVHKFVTLGTLEEKIDDMIARKQALNEQVVGQSENWITELSRDELASLFTLRKSWLNG
ncbi:DEAD/DEAH box helicase [Paenibacillus abyssi]|uniref:ATP-dependent helicase n=1 Tax=Paenibacillus abyssi TaxID=1340531 RepID=A0A917CUR8_9BACL|nr:DEAD/DEAH box helicase [Paenibacillus abyssi]GGF98371.1 ATP-dependent helicase [Paenibacillus abyssi]